MLSFVLYLKFLDNKKLFKLFLSLICSFYFGLKFNLWYSFKKCPECYGDELCWFFQNHQIQLTWFSCFLSIFNPLLTKSVFHGVFNETGVVIKRKIGVSARIDFNELTLNSHEAQNVILCPSVKNVEFLFNQIEAGFEEKKLWMDVKASIEPLLLVFFQSQGIWPIAKYLGACGDFIVEEYKGEPLANFRSSDFKRRCFLASGLLEMVQLFTFGHPTLAFYFTDYSLHNLVVDSNGKVSLIDLDNVIISNKSLSEGNYYLDGSTHISEILDDQNYAFSPHDICYHKISDHNYFLICKYLLTHPEDGLLKDIPIEFNKRSELLELLHECTQPEGDDDRFSAGQKLQSLIEEIIKTLEIIPGLYKLFLRSKNSLVVNKSAKMTVDFKVFKKSSPNGKITLYLGRRDFVDHVSFVDPIDGIVVVDDEYIENRKIFGQIVCSFRYGREEDEIMGLNFQKDLYLASAQIYPPLEQKGLTRMQEKLLKKLGPDAYPFTFNLTPNAPMSVTLQPGPEDQGQPCGLHYYVKIFAGESESDRSHRRSTVTLGIRKIQFAPSKQGRQPCTIVRKDFMLSPGDLELEMTLDKQLYRHGEKVTVSICIRNNSNKVVKKIKAVIQQGVDIVLFQNGQYRSTVACVETQEGCPVQPGSCLQKLFHLVPTTEGIKNRRGVALEGQIKNQESKLASSSLLASPDSKDVFGIIVSYIVKVKLFLGALGGEVVAELPMLLMQPKEKKIRNV